MATKRAKSPDAGAGKTSDADRLARLEQESRFLQALMEYFPDRIYFKDRDSRFIFGSRSFAHQFNLDHGAELLGKTDFDFFSEVHARDAFADEQEIIRTGEQKLNLEEMETWPDGRITWCSTSKVPFRDEQGRIIGTFGISRDITRRKAAERERQQLEIQLRHTQKLESIGALAAGIAHEINTPTQYIGDNATFLDGVVPELLACLQAQRQFLLDRRSGPTDPNREAELLGQSEALDLDYLAAELPKAIRQTLDGVARVAGIVGAMKDFSHPGRAGKALVDLNKSIQSTLIVSRNEWKYVATLETDLDPALPPVPCLQGEINQAILNLVVNAAHAIAETLGTGSSGELGVIRIATRQVGQEVEIAISDTGAGMTEPIRERIFEPFFTTKPVGKGTGQGLSIAHSLIADRHGGQISFESKIGVGTTFTIRLPVGGRHAGKVDRLALP